MLLLVVLLFPLAFLLVRLVAVTLIVLRRSRLCRSAFVVMDHSSACQPAQQQGARDKQHTDVAEALEEGGYHVISFLPTSLAGQAVDRT
jgi:hypothetical protein